MANEQIQFTYKKYIFAIENLVGVPGKVNKHMALFHAK